MFSNEGTCLSMPCYEQVAGFPSSEDDLVEFPLDSWKGLHFLGSGPAFEVFKARMEWFSFEGCVHHPELDANHSIEANWALYVDNYLEGFHIPFVHPGLNQAIEWDSYSTETFDGGVLQTAHSREGEPAFEDGIAAYYWWLFPNTMLNVYPWGLSLNIVVPKTTARCEVIYRAYVLDYSLRKGAGGELDAVETEDQQVVEAVQRGLASDSYDRGRYSPTMEQGVHHFHRMYSRWL